MTTKDLRSWIILMEQATHHTVEDLEKQIVEIIRDQVAHEDNIDGNSEWVEDHVFAVVSKDPQLMSMVKTYNLANNIGNRKWLNAVFTKHMDKTIQQFERLAQRQLDQQAIASADPQTIKFLKAIGTAMTATLSPRDIRNLAWYSHSPKQIVVTMPDNMNVPLVFLGVKAQKFFDMDLNQIKQTLTDMSIRAISKPKAHKSSPSYYD